MRATERAALTLAVALALAGCGLGAVETAAPDALDPGAIPTGPIEPQGGDATGPIVELGSGRLLGLGWRYSVYPSADGRCTQLETAEFASARCAASLLPEGAIFGDIGQGELPNGVRVIEGVAAEEVATVWVILESGLRVPAVLLPLDDAELDGAAFLAFIPADEVVTHLQAIRLNGEVLDTVDLR